ncbi:MAG: hypothetical protein IKS47_05680 [Bacteroidales bacterium]|nr:hypothetical protein [Bacteroidales bacterium]
MLYTVREVGNAREFRLFYQFQNRLYRDCATYVPTLDYDQRHTLAKSPCLDYCQQMLLLCYDGKGRVAGRCCAIINPRYNALYGTRRMRFGWTDFIEDFEAARTLIAAAEEWGRSQGMTEIHGPLGYNTMYKQGLVVEGFDSVPQANNLYNFPYYKDFLERLGFEKEADWIQYKVDATQPLPARLDRIAEDVRQRYSLRIGRIAQLKRQQELVARFFEEYNASFSKVRNFIPFTEKEIAEEGAAYLSRLSDDHCCIVLDAADGIAAFAICFPSLSQALQKAGGRLFPLGWWHLLHAQKHVDTVDMLLVGVAPKWQGKGLPAILHSHLGHLWQANGIHWAISNPQYEDNPALKVWDAYPQKEFYIRRRVYLKSL